MDNCLWKIFYNGKNISNDYITTVIVLSDFSYFETKINGNDIIKNGSTLNCKIGVSVYGYCLYIYMVLIYLYIYRTVTYITSPICPKIRSGTFTKQHRLLYIVVGEVIFSPIDEKIFSEQLCVYCRPNRFLVHTLLYTLCSKHNNGVFIRDRMRSATRLWLGLSKAGQSKCTLRYFAQTANNIPALIRYRFMTLTCLVGRHSGRESGSVRVRLQLSVRLKL